MARIRKDDLVKIISGDHKGTTGKVSAVHQAKTLHSSKVLASVTVKVKPSQLNPRGGKKDIHVATPLTNSHSSLTKKPTKTSRVGYSKNADGAKVRVARQQKIRRLSNGKS
jgi:large subunit ribosomal protein L24